MKETKHWVSIPEKDSIHPNHRLMIGLVIVACIVALAMLMIAGWVVSRVV